MERQGYAADQSQSLARPSSARGGCDSCMGAIAVGAACPTQAANTNVAVAANFTEPAKEIARLFEGKTGHKAILKLRRDRAVLYADHPRPHRSRCFFRPIRAPPRKLVDDGLAVADSLFTYAVGKIALFSRNTDLVKGRADFAPRCEVQQDRYRQSDDGPLWRRRH